MPAPGNFKITLNQEEKDYLKTLVNSGVTKEISTDKNGIMTLKHTNDYIKSKYSISDAFLKNFTNAVKDLNNRKQHPVNYQKVTTTQDTITPNVSVSNWHVYFTQSDVQAYFSLAASLGVGPMMIAWDSLMTMIGGPVGTIISIALDIIGTATMANFCYLVIQSEYFHKGVYIGINWNGPFPNYDQGLW